MPAAYAHDVFISYTNADRPWAEKLYHDLDAQGIAAFLDDAGLRVGDRWEPQLLHELKSSQSLVVLWSDKARGSDWVSNEVYRFCQIVDPNAQGCLKDGRAVISLILEGENKALAPYQAIKDLEEAGAYTPGADKVDPVLWREVVNRAANAIKNGGSIPVHIATLAMTQDELRRLDPGEENTWGTLQEALEQMGMDTKDDLLQYYGNTRNAWRPFGSSEDIQTILSRVEAQVNERFDQVRQPDASPIRFSWSYVNEEFFWSTKLEDFSRERDHLATHWSIIVIDPLSLFQKFVQQRLGQLQSCLQNPKALVLVLAPFSIPASLRQLRKLLEAGANSVFHQFYEPSFSMHTARVEPDVCHELDLKRSLLTALASQAIGSAQPVRPEFLNQ